MILWTFAQKMISENELAKKIHQLSKVKLQLKKIWYDYRRHFN